MGKFGHKNWSSPNWLKSGTDINCFILVSNSMLIFLIFFHSYFLGQIWSQNLKFSKLTEIWYQGTLLYVYHNFNIYFCKVFVLHSFLGKFDSNLVPNSVIVNNFSVSQHASCYVQVYKVHFTIRYLSDLKTWKYIQLLKEINIFLTAIWLPHGQLWAIIKGAASLIRC